MLYIPRYPLTYACLSVPLAMWLIAIIAACMHGGIVLTLQMQIANIIVYELANTDLACGE